MPNPNNKGRPPLSRAVTVSKALSYILRHAAEKEGLKMDAQGYANVADVLAWRKLKSLKATFPEIVDAVANSDKKRFALLYIPSGDSGTPATTSTATDTATSTDTPTDPTQQTEQTTLTALAAATSTPTPPSSSFLIRATQGHSIKSIEAAGLLEKLTLDDKASDKFPKTVVHGTFHSTWPAIFASGGLKCMGRNQVHFATGPALEEVLGEIAKRKQQKNTDGEGETGEKGEAGKVISGMRRDAQVLVYVNVERALAAGCPFWRSENGVVLSEGMEVEVDGKKETMVPLSVVDVVVERKLGLGRMWEKGAVVQQWPSEWGTRPPVKGKGRGRGRGSDGRDQQQQQQ
ncbi:hypothetical protein BO70DRAFT_425987 [Aspergillus heteromorphus CBS 117.55]|uniref:2'-phosphotransferase n=1 Tax=Aspergillus heteromorphus CBS 117.55 TaxID=1448321 RepID=A0A317WYP8_9EURO|nr:uncharacterized protein BO70DRAFT_425987 [Aspergillus heteromorphus CBS 117.55]PWY91081.1 hypothetical protein BO70DRAFT_425987 [Aspergillus heteromorphus CBS 117.55]